jgi:hypothetical protein
MKTEYNGIEITYDEDRNEWLFELRGRSRRADSLFKAKEAIDKEPKEKRTQTFPRFEAYLWSFSEMKVVTVTSLAEDGYYREGQTFWVVDKEGRRRKERNYSLFPVNDHNTALIGKIQAKDAERERIGKEIEGLKEKLQKASMPKEIL